MGRGKPTPGVKVELGGGTRTLRYDNRAFYELEGETGKTFSELRPRLVAGSARAFTAVIWAGLLHAEPNLRVEDTIDLIDMEQYPDLAQAVIRAVSLANGVDPDELEEDEDAGEEEGRGDPTDGTEAGTESG